MTRLEEAAAIIKELGETEQGYSEGYAEQHYVCVWCGGCLDTHMRPNGDRYQCSPHKPDCLMIRAQEWSDK